MWTWRCAQHAAHCITYLETCSCCALQDYTTAGVKSMGGIIFCKCSDFRVSVVWPEWNRTLKTRKEIAPELGATPSLRHIPTSELGATLSLLHILTSEEDYCYKHWAWRVQRGTAKNLLQWVQGRAQIEVSVMNIIRKDALQTGKKMCCPVAVCERPWRNHPIYRRLTAKCLDPKPFQTNKSTCAPCFLSDFLRRWWFGQKRALAPHTCTAGL